jgi:hypothetical protein
MANQTKYKTYTEVPFFSKEKTFWLFVLLFWPLAVFMLTRRIYYPDGDQIGCWEKGDYLFPCLILGILVLITIWTNS